MLLVDRPGAAPRIVFRYPSTASPPPTVSHGLLSTLLSVPPQSYAKIFSGKEISGTISGEAGAAGGRGGVRLNTVEASGER